ncbi:hypothetical protein [Amycolatopsis azurea]|nr:hypothetical protein [Amycolatopsis azurea]
MLPPGPGSDLFAVVMVVGLLELGVRSIVVRAEAGRVTRCGRDRHGTARR